MSQAEEGAKKSPPTIFGYPIRDWLILLAFLGSGTAGVFTFGGTPGQTRQAIVDQTDSIGVKLDVLKEAIDLNSYNALRNSRRIDKLEGLESRMDALDQKIEDGNQLLLDGLKNLDGYMRYITRDSTN